MKRLFWCMLCIATLLILVPGCGQYIEWGKTTFKNADCVCVSLRDIRQTDVRFAPIRNDFMTIALPRVLYLSDAVVQAHNQLQLECSGAVAHKQEQRSNNNENKQMVFSLSVYDDKENWALSLCKDGVQYKATEIKAIDLDREYRLIFGPAATRYQQHIYRVTFDATVGKPFSLILCNGEYRETLNW